MRGLFDAIERERTMDAARFLKKWIDLWREGVYDVVTQFTSIFLERPPPTTHSTLPPDLRPFLNSFTHTLIQQLLQVLSKTIPLITDSPALSSLLTQLSYCSSSFARIGLDFRALFPPIFEKAVRDKARPCSDPEPSRHSRCPPARDTSPRSRNAASSVAHSTAIRRVLLPWGRMSVGA